MPLHFPSKRRVRFGFSGGTTFSWMVEELWMALVKPGTMRCKQVSPFCCPVKPMHDKLVVVRRRVVLPDQFC